LLQVKDLIEGEKLKTITANIIKNKKDLITVVAIQLSVAIATYYFVPKLLD